MKSFIFLLLFLVSPIYAMNLVDLDEKVLKSLAGHFKADVELIVSESETETKNQITSLLKHIQSKPEFYMFLGEIIEKGDFDIAENLLARCPEVDVNWKHPDHEQSLIHLAARNGDIKTLEILLKRGANIQSISKGRKNILHMWTLSGKSEFLDYILIHHKEAWIELVNGKCDPGLTPLLLAVRTGHTEAAMQLIKNGAHVDEIGIQGYNILHSWACHADAQFLNYLCDDYKDHIQKWLTAETTREKLTPLLFTASGKPEAAKLLIQKGANIDEINTQGLNILHSWVYNADAQFLSFLCDNYKDHIQKWLTAEATRKKLTPLLFTAFLGKPEAGKLLIQKGANIDEKSTQGLNILHAWISSQNKEYLNYLFEQYPDSAAIWLHEKNKAGETPLLYAVLNGKTEAAKLLIQKGANIELNILHYWVLNTKTEFLDYLFENFPTEAKKLLNVGITGENTPLSFAVIKGKTEAAKLLIQKGANIIDIDASGYNILHHWISNGETDFLDYLFENFPSEARKLLLARTIKEGLTPLSLAIKSNINKAKLLSAKIVNFRDTNKNEYNVLHHWVFSQNGEFLDYLFNQYPKKALEWLHAKASDEELTPLLFALCYGYSEAAKFLIQKGAKIGDKSKNGENILHLWTRSQNEELFNYLFEQFPLAAYTWLHETTNKDKLTPLSLAIKNGKFQTAKLFIQKKTNINETDANGHNILHHWIFSQNGEFLDYLFDKYPKNAQAWLHAKAGNEELTPLLRAVCYGYTKAAKYLIQKGAKIDEKSKNGENILHLWTRRPNEELINYLFEQFPRDAQTWSRGKTNKDKLTPLSLAIKWDQKEAAELLRKKNCSFLIVQENIINYKKKSLQKFSDENLKDVYQKILEPNNLHPTTPSRPDMIKHIIRAQKARNKAVSSQDKKDQLKAVKLMENNNILSKINPQIDIEQSKIETKNIIPNELCCSPLLSHESSTPKIEIYTPKSTTKRGNPRENTILSKTNPQTAIETKIIIPDELCCSSFFSGESSTPKIKIYTKKNITKKENRWENTIGMTKEEKSKKKDEKKRKKRGSLLLSLSQSQQELSQQDWSHSLISEQSEIEEDFKSLCKALCARDIKTLSQIELDKTIILETLLSLEEKRIIKITRSRSNKNKIRATLKGDYSGLKRPSFTVHMHDHDLPWEKQKNVKDNFFGFILECGLDLQDMMEKFGEARDAGEDNNNNNT